MAKYTVVYDACVLYPQTLRDLLMHLALADIFKAKWSATIHEEWMRNVHKNKPEIPYEKLERARDLMDEHVRDGLVVDFEPLIPSLTLPDSDDRHVLAAAIRCGADAIVTSNLRDFPHALLSPWGVEALHPDDFILAQFDLYPGVVCGCVKRQREFLKKPPRTVEEHLAKLRAIPLPQTVERLVEFNDLL